jgi:Rrf2 family protein
VAAKGQGGGYALARDTTHISVWDIVTALDSGFKNFAPPKLTRTSPYPKLTHCQTNQIWKTLEQSIETTLTDMTLAELLAPTQNPVTHS